MEPKTDGDLHGPPQAQPYLATPRQPSWSLPSSEHQHGWLASPCSLILPSLPSQYASMALAKLSEEERLLQRYPSPRRCGLLSFTLLGEATAGQKKKQKTTKTHYTLRPRFLKAIPSSAGGCAAHLEIPSRPLICLFFDMHLSKSQALAWMPAHLNCSHLTRWLCVREICPFGEGKGNTAPKMF